jgi:NADH-quinone oxidoreductase subunit N
VSFLQLFESMLGDTQHSLRSFVPELVLCATIVLLLATRLTRLSSWIPAFWVALIGSAAGFYLATFPDHLDWLGTVGRWVAAPSAAQPELFTGLLIYDRLTLFFRSVLLLFAVLFVVFTRLSGIPDREDGRDFYTLVLGATLGMCLMASSNHLLLVFLGVEMASVPCYALAGLLKGRRQSSEAALKYAVYGAGAAGVMLYGISLLAGALGTAHLPTMARQLAALQAGPGLGDLAPVLILGGLMVGVGVAFKLSAVPFHFWCPDVFEGAAAEVNAFLSVASKAAALGLLVRLAVGFGHVPAEPQQLALADPAHAAAPAASDAAPAAMQDRAAQSAALQPVRTYMLGLVGLLAAITCTFGNLAAYGQTNIKRLLAYSTIAHAGYLMLPVAAALAAMGTAPRLAESAIGAMCFYVAVYLFMNLSAFAVVAYLRNAMGSEQIADYAGLVRRAPGVTVLFSIVLLSLLGLPPLAGFAAKFVIFSTLVDSAAAAPAFRTEMYALLAVGGLNTFLSLFYYLRVVKVMTIDPEPATRLPVEAPLVSLFGGYLVLVTLPVLALGVAWNELNEWARSVVAQLLS